MVHVRVMYRTYTYMCIRHSLTSIFLFYYFFYLIVSEHEGVVIGQSKRSRTQVYSGKKTTSGPQGSAYPKF